MKRAVVLLCAVAACSRPAPPGDAPRAAPSARAAVAGPRSVHVEPRLVADGRIGMAPVVRRVAGVELRVPGQVRSDAAGSAEAGSLASGRVAALLVSEGAHVQKGAVLAWVDSPDAARAAADVLRARARAKVSARRLERQLALEAQAATSAGAVDDARADDALARADLAAARTVLATFGVAEPSSAPDAGVVAARVPVRAPIDGVVSRRDALLGAAVAPDRSMFSLVADGRAFVVAGVPETAAPPADGARATLAARSGGVGRCGATVVGSLHLVDEASRTVPLRLKPDDGCSWLAPGAYLDVVIERAAVGGAGLVVPASAIVEVAGEPTAFVAGAGEGDFLARVVTVHPTGAGEVVVDSGLAEGERVVVTGSLLLAGELGRAALEGR